MEVSYGRVKKKEIYTIDDIYDLPDGERAELIDGNLYYMAPPSTSHQRISMHLSSKILNHIEQNNGACEVFAAPFAVFLDDNNKNYVEPDISVVCDKEKLDDKGYHGAPDWIIEIVSPGSKSMDYFIKLFKYRTAGVREYWVVNPDRKMVTVYYFEQDRMDEYSFGEDVPVGIYEGFSLKVEG